MNTLVSDIRYALRHVVKSPGFSAIVTLMVALAIGANSTIFSVVNTLLLRPRPIATSSWNWRGGLAWATGATASFGCFATRPTRQPDSEDPFAPATRITTATRAP